jgi:IS5 family transposase
MLNPKHPLYKLADEILWEELEDAFLPHYSHTGRRAKPIRLMVSLLLLKQMYDLSDESVVEQWVQNPYFQYFSGEETFRWDFPCASSDLVHFRHRIGEKGVQKILEMSIKLHGQDALEKCVVADTTVQEKNITYPTDLKLHCKIIKRCRVIADHEGILLRQSYVRIEKELLLAQRFKKNPKTYKKAVKAQRKLRTIATRLSRELSRKLPEDRRYCYQSELDLFAKVLRQKKTDQNKIYSLHEPEVYCMSKGKEHKKYEFGSKVSFLVTAHSGIITGAVSFAKNEYDGHTLAAALQQYNELTGKVPHEVIADRGYSGKKSVGETAITIPGKRKQGFTAYEKSTLRKKFRRRSSIEPIIGHLKSDTRLGRNYLKGRIGDMINAMLAAAAFNLRKWMRRFFAAFTVVLQIYQHRYWKQKYMAASIAHF